MTVNGIKLLRVSEINSLVKEILEGSFPSVCLEGEVSNFRPSSSGHLYFTLKDETSAISAVMFKGKARYLPFTPKDGLLVHATGSLSVYEARGSYQIVVDSMKLAGQGDILSLLEERKKKLASEGLFDTDRKKKIPFFPQTVAVITSPTGAAIRDIIQIIRRRNPHIGITILPAVVQGNEASDSLVRQLDVANTHRLGDVIIIGRGGGSLEDLLPFSEEKVVRKVCESDIPVISAVGHEIDWALTDFAADLRAPTPSAAAELVSPLKSDILERIESARYEIEQSMHRKTDRFRLIMNQFSRESLELRFRRIEQPLLLRFDDAKEALLEALSARVLDTRLAIERMSATLEAGNPRTILARGYAMVRDKTTGAIIRSSLDAPTGSLLEIIPEQGTITARVEATEHEEI